MQQSGQVCFRKLTVGFIGVLERGCKVSDVDLMDR